MKNILRGVFFGVLVMIFSGCFLVEEEPDRPETKELTYTVPSGYNLYLVVHNLTTSSRNWVVYGENFTSVGTLKSIVGDGIGGEKFSSSSSYPVYGLPMQYYQNLPPANWRKTGTKTFGNILFTYGDTNSALDYGRNPSNWVIGTTELSFKVVNIEANTYTNITAKLWAIGTNMTTGASPINVLGGVAYIFVDVNATVSPDKITNFAVNFNGTNGIYAKLTNILGGYEDGGGPHGDGGVDTNKNIYILFTDIKDGYSGSGGFVAGYYDPGNDFPKSLNPNSSEKQMFVIDTDPTLNLHVSLALSTLIHEAQHMINWGQKYFVGGVEEETWLNEACSMAAEDVLDEFVPDEAYRVYANGSRMSYFLSQPERGLFYWGDYDVLYDYGKSYAYLAFLMRQTSPLILKEIVSEVGRDKVGKAAVEAALSKLNAGKTFDETVRLWQKSLIYNERNLSSLWKGYKTNAILSGYELKALDLSSYGNNKSTTGPVFYYFRSSRTVFTWKPYATYIFKGRPASGNEVKITITDDPNMTYEVIITNI
ncbi:M30 family zinc metallopeptidase [Thermospira aquatica]|uniref:Peptidase M30 n=1 Tax=Thermospira aquatica TaxID=2828656 RepID=A0AAX3BDU8_9SPIR|nr:hypothetical protein [Thermospira aquatica]URA10410.1 hypothetical protein KDW03_00985 [Thermospira aquatica]